jgi:hypothetical protein
MLPCTDAPWHTPQNLDDAHLRTLKNEPSNLPSVLQAIYDSSSSSSHPAAVSGILGAEEEDGGSMAWLRRELFETSVKVFQLPRQHVKASAAAPAPAEAADVVRDVHQSQRDASANDPSEVSTESTSSVHDPSEVSTESTSSVHVYLTITLILTLTPEP